MNHTHATSYSVTKQGNRFRVDFYNQDGTPRRTREGLVWFEIHSSRAAAEVAGTHGTYCSPMWDRCT